MYLSRKILDFQLTTIGKLFGDRDHSTVVHAIDKITEEMSLRPEFENQVAELEKRILSRT
jgi:chromosomal replication initiator protein